MEYKTILVAIDLTDEAEQVLSRAVTMAKQHQATLTLAHVVEPVGYAYGGDLPLDLTELQQQLETSAREQLSAHGERHGIAKQDQRIIIGRPGTEIRRLAHDLGADLTVVGSHGRHGLQLLLGSTANAVLHGAENDVLAVRVR
ncbi:MAG: universal stress protein [Halomonadaceae bacterium]|nr:MAG: universal stress protein [Halomonadaceae bacterium]